VISYSRKPFYHNFSNSHLKVRHKAHWAPSQTRENSRQTLPPDDREFFLQTSADKRMQAIQRSQNPCQSFSFIFAIGQCFSMRSARICWGTRLSTFLHRCTLAVDRACSSVVRTVPQTDNSATAFRLARLSNPSLTFSARSELESLERLASPLTGARRVHRYPRQNGDPKKSPSHQKTAILNERRAPSPHFFAIYAKMLRPHLG